MFTFLCFLPESSDPLKMHNKSVSLTFSIRKVNVNFCFFDQNSIMAAMIVARDPPQIACQHNMSTCERCPIVPRNNKEDEKCSSKIL